ncbi:hypothetical protein [Metabacillus rhizolycopersici]|uniref:Uncharacterized protein n=1 Tax=Metabacillus rhizolycopersici TaxID=2875709 RepID=A0ABS7V0P2_9BACI|nr:hypothetical protein [Metabacillus rhizolycopersici]MBZ5753843.1 hypothetical protein [Metabacillus rhizolycopersici]
MKKNKLFRGIMTGALSLGMIGGVGIPAFAASNSTSNSAASVEQAVNVKASLDDETKQKVQAIMGELKIQLGNIGVELPTKGDRGNMFADLDDESKEKAEAIMEQLKSDSITQEEAQAQLADLGVELPAKGEKGGHGNMFAGLDDATKEKAEAIVEQLKNDSITQEEAQAQLADLGVELPERADKGGRGDMLAGLDDATKEKAEAIVEQLKNDSITQEEAQTQLADLGVELPAKGEKGDRGDMFADLDDESKEKAQVLIEEAEAQLAELGVNHLPFKGLEASTNEE